MSNSTQSQPSADPPRSAAADLRRGGREATTAVADEVREGVAQGTAYVREEAAARTEDAKQALAREVAATGEALGAAASNLQEQSLQRTLLDEAAKGLTSMSRTLEGRSPGELVGELAEFGRRHPAVFLGGAALAGFAAARLAIASAPSGTSQFQDHGARTPTGADNDWDPQARDEAWTGSPAAPAAPDRDIARASEEGAQE